MTGAPKLLAKAVDVESRSDAIVVSFGAEWYDRLRDRRFTSIIRKRIVKNIQPRWLYFHINAPKSAICARAKINSIETIDLSAAIRSGSELALSTEEILAYLGTHTSVGCYRIADIDFPEREVTTEQLTMYMAYYPPQNFLILSVEGKDLLDKICGFPRRWPKRQGNVQ